MDKISIETPFRVRYSETDRMGYMYYGNYAAWFEVGRVELLRTLGLTYRKMEDDGVILPVRDFSIRYFKPIKYDDAVMLHTTLIELKGAKISFEFEVKNASGDIATTSIVNLVFCDRDTGRPTRVPQELLDRLGI
ncbi:MAG: thioesterase family protein [Bacteroidota bacterium]